MKKIGLLIAYCIPFFVLAQPDSLLSGKYSWKEPTQEFQKNIFSSILFEGKVHDMEWLQMNAISLKTVKKLKQQIPANEEHLLIIKSGNLSITLKDSSWNVGAGSTVLLMPGEKYTLKNAGSIPCNYYVMKYRSKSPVNPGRAKDAGGSLVTDWNQLAFIPNNNGGGRRNFFNRPTAMARKFEIHVTTLKEGMKSHEAHTHKAEEIILVIDNKTEMQIADKFYKGSTGSIYYLGSNVLHGVKNDGIGSCTYFAIQFE